MSQHTIDGVVVLFGATGGIGSELSKTLAERGASLVVSARSEDALKELASPLEALAVPADATDFDAVAEVFAKASKHAESMGKKVVGAANLVGSILLKPAQSTSRSEFDTTMALNVASAFGVVRAGSKAMRGGGSIVLMSSCAAQVGLPNHEAIAAAKGAVIGLTRSAAATLAPKVRVNCIAPGLVDTPMAKPITSSKPALDASVAMHPLERIGEPSDIVPVLSWLLGPESAWVTGQTIGVDGGMANVRGRVKAPARA